MSTGQSRNVGLVGSTREADFEALYRALLVDVRRYAAAHVGRDDVEDVVNATFVSVWQRFDDVPLASPRAWVLGVARNHCRNRWRSGRRSGALVEAIGRARPQTETALSAQGVSVETISAFESVNSGLSADDRELLVLTGWIEMSPTEIAEMLRVSAATVRVRLHRLRTKLSIAMDRSDGVA